MYGLYKVLSIVADWFSRYVLSWGVSTTLEKDFCLKPLESALRLSRPDIFNSDQGSQFTGTEFTGLLETSGVRISMNSRGRVWNNIFVERL